MFKITFYNILGKSLKLCFISAIIAIFNWIRVEWSSSIYCVSAILFLLMKHSSQEANFKGDSVLLSREFTRNFSISECVQSVLLENRIEYQRVLPKNDEKGKKNRKKDKMWIKWVVIFVIKLYVCRTIFTRRSPNQLCFSMSKKQKQPQNYH